jgi:hypothetical protein
MEGVQERLLVTMLSDDGFECNTNLLVTMLSDDGLRQTSR